MGLQEKMFSEIEVWMASGVSKSSFLEQKNPVSLETGFLSKYSRSVGYCTKKVCKDFFCNFKITNN
jgi:hypothetical protein